MFPDEVAALCVSKDRRKINPEKGSPASLERKLPANVICARVGCNILFAMAFRDFTYPQVLAEKDIRDSRAE